MTKIALVVVLLFAGVGWAGSEPKPANYTINVHVSSSALESIVLNGQPTYLQDLKVTIGGKPYRLRSLYSINRLLALGDYKAKLAEDENNNGYDSMQVYEFLFPDGKTRQFQVVGISE